ncbi:hypothetical protein GCM10007874_37220 [Labrys miyagiensis]|uniref:Uncharacterized protein n=2 Tax=Labrys miyagiensis TaxID=346912 RepID=A0ABQ6CKK8_9HYPH|nr:hypothetical protein GCM10007874_37220 [Labrys miyagiensis]
MADDCEVYCRYRGGNLSVHIAAHPGEEAYAGDALLEAVIGPYLHGGLSLGQLCRYAGITINGYAPPLPTAVEILKEGLLDLSGETTFLDLGVICTHPSAIEFYDDIVNNLSEVMGCDDVNGNWHDFKLCDRGEFAIGWRMCLARRSGPMYTMQHWPLEIANIEGVGSFPVFGLIQHAAFQANNPPRWYTYLCRPQKPAILLREKGGLDVDDLWLRLSFPANDESSRQLAEEIYNIFVRRFPPATLLAYNIDTGERVPDQDPIAPCPFDSRVAAWVAGGEDRWFWGTQSCGIPLGYR